MAWGRSNEQWNHTSSLMALIATIHSDPEKGPPPAPANYHPYLPDPKFEIPKATPELLKSLGFRTKKKADDPPAQPEATP
jgi:hypothetical protein